MSIQRIKAHTHRRRCGHAALTLVTLFSFNIPAGDAIRTLFDWAWQADASALWDGLYVSEHRLQTQAVKGLLTQQQALCLLLQGTGLTFVAQTSRRAADGNAYLIVPEGFVLRGERIAYYRDEICGEPKGLGPAFIKVPLADWR